MSKPLYLLLAALAAPAAHGAPDPLPDVAIGPIYVNNRSAFDALRLVLAKSGTGIGLTYCGNGGQPEPLRRSVAASNLEGRLPQLVEQLARVTGFRYGYDSESRVLVLYEGKCDWGSFLAASGSDRPVAAGAAAAAGSASAQPALSGAASAPAAGAEEPVWVISSEQTVRATLRQWAKQADWRLEWEAPVDFRVAHGARYEGEFADAVTAVVAGLGKGDVPIRAELYAGNRVLRIVEGEK